jgi:hypothetical protein
MGIIMGIVMDRMPMMSGGEGRCVVHVRVGREPSRCVGVKAA